MHHSIAELEHNFDQARQDTLQAQARVQDRIANTAAAYTKSAPLYALVPFIATVADAGLGFAGGYEMVLGWAHAPAMAALFDAIGSLLLSAGLVVICWLSDLCREPRPRWRACVFTAFSVSPLLIIGAPLVYFVFTWTRTANWLEMDRILKIGAIALIAGISHCFLFFEGNTCMDALQKWQLRRDKKAFAAQLVGLRDAARALVAGWENAQRQTEQQIQESGASGCPVRLKSPILTESLAEALDTAKAVLVAAKDLPETSRLLSNPMRNQGDPLECLPATQAYGLSAQVGD